MPMRMSFRPFSAWMKKPPSPWCSAARISASRPRPTWKLCPVWTRPASKASRPGCCLTACRRTSRILPVFRDVSRHNKSVVSHFKKISGEKAMQTRKALMATASLAIMACVTGSVSAQYGGARNAGPAAAPAATILPYQSPPRHLLYIATPGDEGADDQSGVVVLDADHDYRFVKRIPYGLAASELPGPKISGMTSSIPANKIYVTTDG